MFSYTKLIKSRTSKSNAHHGDLIIKLYTDNERHSMAHASTQTDKSPHTASVEQM